MSLDKVQVAEREIAAEVWVALFVRALGFTELVVGVNE